MASGVASPVALAWASVDKDTARARLKAAGDEYAAISLTYAEVVARLNEAIEDARVAGLPPVESAKLAQVTRETIRRRWKRAAAGGGHDSGG